MSQLALFGGKPVVENKFPCLKFKNKDKIEDEFKKYLYKQNNILDEGWEEEIYVLAVNSCTSALQISCGAIGLQKWDEVIVTPWSMSCSATAPMIYGATPVFADIEKDYFCLDSES